MTDLTVRKVINTEFGKIEIMSLEYRTMNALSYWGYDHSGHLIGYSASLSAITKRLKKASKV